MRNSTTDEFKDLAKTYTDAFKRSFSQDGISEVGTSKISFAEVRVMRFILVNSLDDSSFR